MTYPLAPLARFLQAAAVAVLVLGLAGAVLPGDAGTAAGTAAVAAVVATPLLRVAYLALRWARRRDRRFSAAAVGLLLVVGSGALLALTTS